MPAGFARREDWSGLVLWGGEVVVGVAVVVEGDGGGQDALAVWCDPVEASACAWIGRDLFRWTGDLLVPRCPCGTARDERPVARPG